jgi:hypothetical protein
MNSTLGSKILATWLLALCTASVAMANGSLNVDLAYGAQAQARDLLSGTVNGRPKAVSSARDVSGHTMREERLDPQDQARRLILGNPNFPAGASGKSSGGWKCGLSPTICPDGAEAARHMILGNRA